MEADERDFRASSSEEMRGGIFRKWHPSPHNRFKMCAGEEFKRKFEKLLSKRRSQPEASKIISSKQKALFIALLAASLLLASFSAGSAQETPPPTGSSQEEMAQVRGAPISGEQLRPQRKSPQRVYRIRAAPFNGRLSVPAVEPAQKIQLKASDASSVFAGSGTASHLRVSEEGASGLEFGSRAPVGEPRRFNSPASSNATRSGLGQEANIAALSPTLRLTSSDGRSQPAALLGSNLGESSKAEAAPASARRAKSQRLSSLLRQPPTSQASSGPTSGELENPAGSENSDSILELIDEFDSKITTNRTKAQLSCDSGEMILRLNFSEPFRGIVYPDHDRLSPCRFFGDGHHNYELRLPLRGCGTRQAAPRFFVNEVVVRFHKSLELEEDEVKTLICRYPPPLAAPLPPELAGTGELLHGTPSNGSNRNSGIEEESAVEFVDPWRTKLGKKPDVADSTASGNIETLSENLLVAPSSEGLANQPGQRKQLEGGYVGQNSTGNSQRSGQLNRMPPPPVITADLFDQRDFVSGQTAGAGSNQESSGILERLSSVQLLFLISSLMFLFLVGLGLAVSYFCFRRHQAAQRRRRRVLGLAAGDTRRAGLVERKQRLYASPSAVFGQPGAPVQHSSLLYQPAGLLASREGSSQQSLYNLNSSSQQAALHRMSSSSSPESDLSARQLLAADSARYQDPYGAYNRAFVPEPTALLEPAAAQRQPIYARHLPLALRHRQLPVLGRRVGQPQQFEQAPAARTYQQYGTGGRLLHAHHSSPFRSQEALLTLSPDYLVSPKPSAGNWREQQLWQASARRPSKLYRAQRVQVAGQQPQVGALWRAKSLSSVQAQPYQVGEQNSAETLLRRQARGHNYRDNLANEQLHSPGEARPKSKHKQPRTGKRLILKSIEDSYITNLTEVHEQEYKKSDTRRPLSLAQWRRMQPKQPPPPKSPSESGSERDDSSQRARNNLRSLTELDVSFAKSSLLIPAGGQQQDFRSQFGQKTNTLERGVQDKKLPKLDRSNSMPDVKELGEEDTKFDRKGDERETMSSPETPDLIVSPDYQLEQNRRPQRLELLEGGGSVSSRNSVSYV